MDVGSGGDGREGTESQRSGRGCLARSGDPFSPDRGQSKSRAWPHRGILRTRGEAMPTLHAPRLGKGRGELACKVPLDNPTPMPFPSTARC